MQQCGATYFIHYCRIRHSDRLAGLSGNALLHLLSENARYDSFEFCVPVRTQSIIFVIGRFEIRLKAYVEGFRSEPNRVRTKIIEPIRKVVEFVRLPPEFTDNELFRLSSYVPLIHRLQYHMCSPNIRVIVTTQTWYK